MAHNVFRNGASLFRVIENAPIPQLKEFLLQEDPNFKSAHEAVRRVFSSSDDEEMLRSFLLKELSILTRDQLEPVEVECQRALGLTEAKGPSALQDMVERQLNNEDCELFEAQPGELAKSLWIHSRYRRTFDDAVSYKAIRSWRNAGRLFAAFNVESDLKDRRFSAAAIDTDKLGEAIGKKLKTSRRLSFSLVELPQVPEYPPSVLVIVRFAGQQTSVATHGEHGERRLLYFLPQDEAVLIYTPALERIEVAATRAAVRKAVAECFAVEALGHDLSAKPLLSAIYDTSRFLRSMDLPLPDVPGSSILSARVTELELRVENWNSRLALKAAKVSMEDLVELYLHPSQTLRHALGVSRVLR